MTLSEWLDTLWLPAEPVALMLEREDVQAFCDEDLRLSTSLGDTSLSEYLHPITKVTAEAVVYLRRSTCADAWVVIGWDLPEQQARDFANAPKVRFRQYLKETPLLTDLLFEE